MIEKRKKKKNDEDYNINNIFICVSNTCINSNMHTHTLKNNK
jgi:hypothetical protein